LTFYQNVSPEKELREASNAAESLLRDFAVEASMRLDVFNAKVAAEKNIKASGQWEKLSPEAQRLVEKMVNCLFGWQIQTCLMYSMIDPRWHTSWPCSS
jgi:metallopeptidase MepB